MVGRLFLLESLVSPPVPEIPTTFRNFLLSLFCQLPATAVQHKLAARPNGTAQAYGTNNGVGCMEFDACGCPLRATNAHVNGVAFNDGTNELSLARHAFL